ncbi:unnamed protein product [Rotaria socialis]|uniref:Uncharacterized protein n=3 Tax=Rotaria socialis TaxID=392032 RepID=A0A818P8D5_9BILA|nr:unnamed protein product [Rotaria socialis]
MSLLTKSECHICEGELTATDDVILTECHHTFHRSCAQKRLDTRNKSDCPICHQQSAITNALSRDTATTITQSTEDVDDLSENIEEESDPVRQMDSEKSIDTNENCWKCDECSVSNAESIKRCQNCGKLKYDISSTFDEEVTNEESPSSKLSVLVSSKSNTSTSETENKTTKQNMKSIVESDEQKSLNTKFSYEGAKPSAQSGVIVYIIDLPSNINDNIRLANLIQSRMENSLQITPIIVKCYSKLSAGFIYVRDNQIKNRLIDEIKQLALDPVEGTSLISFRDKIELISYIVIDKTNERKNVILPKPDEILKRWIQINHGERTSSCDQVNMQFPNIYRIVSTSFDDSVAVMSNPDFLINKLLAHVYVGAQCRYFEDLPKSITKEQLEMAICDLLGIKILPSFSLHIELNKQTSNACIIAADIARECTARNVLYLDGKSISIKENLAFRLFLHPLNEDHDNNDILNHKIFGGQAKIIGQRRRQLILEISNKKVYDECLTFGVLRIGTKSRLIIENYIPLNDPEELEIDADVWYDSEMMHYKPDIMQFIADLDHPIFRYKWNADAWLQKFQNAKSSIFANDAHSDLSSDQIRHLLQMTVMLNTIGVIRKKTYLINNQQIKLNLDSKLRTIVYNHDSLLELSQSIESSNTPYTETKVKVINADCVFVYEECSKKYKKPLLLNMANATSPGGGYRKGDGAQEENLFRRSDYFRSLDIDLDSIQDEIPERFYCSNDGKIRSLVDLTTMYPIDEYGAIYTSGLTFFRNSEDKGYEYMDKPLEGVHALAVAAYRNPKLDGNLLSPKYAVGMRKKIENLLSIAHYHKHDCLILSALGCGAFRNPPDHIAKLFRSVIEQYAGFFQTIIFAIIDDHNSGQQHNPDGNFKSFKDELDELRLEPLTPLTQPNTNFGPYRVSPDGLTISDVSIFDLQPCQLGAKCNEIQDSKHSRLYSHPSLCKERSLKGTCTKLNDSIHMSSFIHLNPCKNGAQCKDIDNTKHNQEYEHPSFCPNRNICSDTSDEHENAYRHLPLCKSFLKCLDYQKHVASHCENFRHCNPSCQDGKYCANFHVKQHIENYKHPFPNPCPFTPYHCSWYEQFISASDNDVISGEIEQHCLDFAHVCVLGRNCANNDSLHWEKSIHVRRPICSLGNECTKLIQEDHLSSFTHPNVCDIRFLCKDADKCHDRHDATHMAKFRHIITLEDSGIVRYYNLNQNIDFVQNQKHNVERVRRYVENEKWEPLPSGSIPQNIIDWIRTVQPVHRCRPEIFESILLHGHVMSRDYMDNLKKSPCIIDSILQHNELRRIKYFKEKKCAKDIKEYVTALVIEELEGNNSENTKSDEHSRDNVLISPDGLASKSRKELIRNKEVILSSILSEDEITTIKTKAIEIAQASIKLHSNPAGINHPPDKELGTNRNVFSILGPHLGQYGDVFIVFKREILHHPDSNFTVQAATSYASGRAFKWRPWLGTDPGSQDARVKLFHSTKLHASIPDYEYATALELIATTSQTLKKKSMNIDLPTILKRWLTVDSHMTIEAHLPQLIPLDYIDHIYMSKNIFDAFNNKTRETIKTIFDNRISIQSIESRKEHENFVMKELIDKFGQRDIHSISRPIQGAVITIPATDFNDHFVLPLTISQTYEQYKIDHPQIPTDGTVYIYWQIMNGDMMLTLTNEEINTGEKQPNLRCLTCYIAEKPSRKINSYHEHASYLHSGLLFQHEIVVQEEGFSASSTSFFIGCNTDDFMTFRLEIQRSTGTVTLSHSGSNSIYNHEQICATFSKSDFDLNQLNFIHVSAGARTVPIRNLFVTFEKQSEPFDSIGSNVQTNLSDLPRDVLDDNVTKKLDQSQAVPKPGRSPVITSSNRFIQRPIIKWSLVFLFSLIILSTSFYVLQKRFDVTDKLHSSLNTAMNHFNTKMEDFSSKLINFQPYSISLSNILILLIRFNWIGFFIIINELLLYHGYFVNYTGTYRLFKEKFQDWYATSRLKYGIFILLLLIGPFLLEIFIFYSSTLLKPFLIIMQTFLRYFWLISLITLCESFGDYEYSSSYVRKYQKIKRIIQDWCIKHRIQRTILFLIILAIPFLLDRTILYSLIILNKIVHPLWTSFVFIVRYNWLILIFILDGILTKQTYFTNLSGKYRDRRNNIDNKLSHIFNEKYTRVRQILGNWYKNDNLESRITITTILILPLIIEVIFLYTIPITRTFLFFSWKLLIFLIHYLWLSIIIMINEFIFLENNYFPKYIQLYKSIKENISDWCDDKRFRRVVILVSIVVGPFILEMCFIWFIPMTRLLFFLLWNLCLLLITYCWLVLIVIISKILEENDAFPKYVEKFKSIMDLLERWAGSSNIKFGIVAIVILAAPAFFEHVTIRSMSLREIFIFLLTTLSLFIIRYCWLALIIIISAIFENNEIFPKYVEKFQSIMDRLRRWTGSSNIKVGIVAIVILATPALFEHVTIRSMSLREIFIFLLTTLILFIIRYYWLALIIIISAIFEENKIFPKYVEKFKSIMDPLDRWAGYSKFKGGILWVSVLSGPFALEMSIAWFLPMMKLLFFLLWKLFIILIRYCWLLLLVIGSEILEETGMFPKFVAKYKELKQQVERWSKDDKLKIGIVIFTVLSGPFLLEMFLFYGIKAIVAGIIFVVKKTFFYLASIFGFYCLSRLIHR